MNYEKINNIIESYYDERNINGALLIDGPWGCGKTYYVKNYLIPFLDKNKIESIVISLYGLDSIDSLRDAIISDQKLKQIIRDEQFFAAYKVGKRLVRSFSKNYMLKKGVDNELFKQLLTFADLSNKIIILEDLERASIQIQDILGFVNDLCENDMAKIIIVANQAGLQNKEDFKKIQEKTIIETIKFNGSDLDSINNILDKFNHGNFSRLLKEHDEDGRFSLTQSIYCFITANDIPNPSNLRLLIHACCLMEHMINKGIETIDCDFMLTIFKGIIAYSYRKGFDCSISWSGDFDICSNLGTKEFPLYKFAYNFIENHELDLEEVFKQNKIFINNRNNEAKNNKTNKYLEVIYEFYTAKETDLLDAIEYVHKFINQSRIIKPYVYYKLGNYLLAIFSELGIDTHFYECEDAMIKNLDKLSINDDVEIYFNEGCEIRDAKFRSILDAFEKKLAHHRKKINRKDLFTYNPKDVKNDCDFIIKNLENFKNMNKFASLIDSDRFISLLKKCTAKQVYYIYSAFREIYGNHNQYIIYNEDKDYLIKLHNKLEKINKDECFDMISFYQIKNFSEYLMRYISLP